MVAAAAEGFAGNLEHDPEKWELVFPRHNPKAFARRSCSNKKTPPESHSTLVERDSSSMIVANTRPSARPRGAIFRDWLKVSLARRDPARLMRRQPRRAGLRLNLGGHHPLGPRPEPDQHVLARAQLGHPEPAQGLHVHEDVGSSLTTGQEAESAQPVEPLDLCPLQPAGRC